MTEQQRKIRVLHLGSPIGLYGAERWILALVKHLPSTIVDSIVGVIRDEPGLGDVPLCREASTLGLDTVEFDGPGKLSIAAISAIRNFVNEKDIDILHTHGYKTDILGLLGTRGTRCKVIATPHGWSTDAGISLQIYEFLDRLAFRFVDAVVPLSPDIYSGLEKMPGLKRRLHLISNGVDISEIDAADAGRELTTDAAGVFRVGYIGQLIPRKGIESLIRAFHALEYAGKRLYIVGEGPQRNVLEALVSDLDENSRVKFLGYRTDRLELLKQFDTFVLPSSLEGIPRCLMEAMAARVPVVASNIPGCTELVKPDVTGLLFDFGNVAGLTAALERLAVDETLRERFRVSGRDWIDENFSASSMATKYTDLYEQLCHRRAAGR